MRCDGSTNSTPPRAKFEVRSSNTRSFSLNFFVLFCYPNSFLLFFFSFSSLLTYICTTRRPGTTRDQTQHTGNIHNHASTASRRGFEGFLFEHLQDLGFLTRPHAVQVDGDDFLEIVEGVLVCGEGGASYACVVDGLGGS